MVPCSRPLARSHTGVRLLATSLAVVPIAVYAAWFASFRGAHAVPTGTGEPPISAVTIDGAVSRLVCFASLPGLCLDRLVTGRRAHINDRQWWRSFFVGDEWPSPLPPLAPIPCPWHC